MRVLVSEIPLHTRTAAHQIAPQGVLARLVVLRIVSIRDNSHGGRRLFVMKDRPRRAGGCRAHAQHDGFVVRCLHAALDRSRGEEARADQAGVSAQAAGVVRMDRDGVIVGVDAADVAGDRQPVGVGRVVLLAQVPDDGQMVAETRGHLPQIELADVVQRGAAAQLLVVLGLLGDQVHGDAESLHVGKHDVPLGQLGDVDAIPDVGSGPDPSVLTIAAIEVVGHEIDTIHALGGEVVQRSDDVLALAALPSRVAWLPVARVRLVAMQE